MISFSFISCCHQNSIVNRRTKLNRTDYNRRNKWEFRSRIIWDPHIDKIANSITPTKINGSDTDLNKSKMITNIIPIDTALTVLKSVSVMSIRSAVSGPSPINIPPLSYV